MRRIHEIWKKLFGRYLWATNTLSCGGLFATGDAIQQKIEHVRGVNHTTRYDWGRTGRMFVVGIMQGPPHHYLYQWLDKYLPGKTGKIILKKVLVDQLLFGPIFAVIFFMGAGTLERKSISASFEEFKDKFPAVYAFDWVLWPPTQMINFYYVPLQYRVLYINCVTVVWDMFLSFMKHKDQQEELLDKKLT